MDMSKKFLSLTFCIVIMLFGHGLCLSKYGHNQSNRHHIQRRSGDAQKEMMKEECDVIANEYVKKFADKSYKDIRDPTVAFFKKCIIEMFDFEMEASPDSKDKENYIVFKELPSFEDKKYEIFSPLKKEFGLYAKVVEIFFTKVGEWKQLLKDKTMKDSKGQLILVCKNLLYTVGARYAYTTFLLWHVSSAKVGFCKADSSDRIFKPESACYPVPSGNFACTAESYVSLIGKDSPDVVQEFNKYIGGLQCRSNNNQHPCDANEMMNHRIYANLMELATPELFTSAGQSDEVKTIEERMTKMLGPLDKSYDMKWFDIVLALMQVVRRQEEDHGLKDDIVNLIEDSEDLSKVLGEFLQSAFDADESKGQLAFDNIATYISNKLSKTMSVADIDIKVKDIFDLIWSYLKATDSYHSFGALRTIVGTMQMKRKEMTERMSLNDYIASAIENFGYAQGTMAKCVIRQEPTYKCVAEASNYLWYTYACLKATKDILVNIGQGESLSEEAKMDTVKARDYLAEMYFIFNKNKREMPEQYFSSLAYKEDVIVEEDGKQEVEPKEQKSKELLKRFFQCELVPECMRKVSKTIFEYTKSMSQYQNKNNAKKKRVVDVSINRLYFDYVNESSKKIVECYKQFMFGSKDPCKIKATIKLRSSTVN